MKKITLSAMAALLALIGSSAVAQTPAELALTIAKAQLTSDLTINNLINWKVGEFSEYNLEAMGMPMGTMKKYVASEEGNNIWFNQDMEGGMIGSQKVEALMDRATGKVLEMKQNGKKVDVPNDPIELIDQESTSITVPAGTFEVVHVTAKSKQIKKIEIWANPRDIALDGAAQMSIEAQIPMMLKLTKFGGR